MKAIMAILISMVMAITLAPSGLCGDIGPVRQYARGCLPDKLRRCGPKRCGRYRYNNRCGWSRLFVLFARLHQLCASSPAVLLCERQTPANPVGDGRLAIR